MSLSIWYWSLISNGKYFECILIYSALEIGVSKKTYFGSQNINLAPWRASEIFLLNSRFDSKRDAAGDDESSWYLSIYPPTVNLTLYGSDSSWR